jgi:Haem-binding domain
MLMKRRKKRYLYFSIIAVIAIFLLIQLIPYGRIHSNPTVVSEPQWASPQTRDMAKKACFDCHSNETVWPWYSNIAPVSWLAYRDVAEGRRRMNFSDWNNYHLREAGELSSAINEGEMPPIQYLLMHTAARLTGVEKKQLIAGLSKTLGQ